MVHSTEVIADKTEMPISQVISERRIKYSGFIAIDLDGYIYRVGDMDESTKKLLDAVVVQFDSLYNAWWSRQLPIDCDLQQVMLFEAAAS